MTTLQHYTYQLRHNDHVVGSICAGGIEVSEFGPDEPIFWAGLHGLKIESDPEERRRRTALRWFARSCGNSNIIYLQGPIHSD